jgi:hypothetical protein
MPVRISIERHPKRQNPPAMSSTSAVWRSCVETPRRGARLTVRANGQTIVTIIGHADRQTE